MIGDHGAINLSSESERLFMREGLDTIPQTCPTGFDLCCGEGVGDFCLVRVPRTEAEFFLSLPHDRAKRIGHPFAIPKNSSRGMRPGSSSF